MTSRSVRLGLVGCGRLAETGYLPAAAAAAGVTVVAVADPDPARRAAVTEAAARHGMAVESHADAAALVDGSELDAVVLATPAAHHVADAGVAVGARLPVLVEKPPAPDAAGAAALVALGPSVRVGFNRRFDPGARRVRAAVPTAGPVVVDLGLRYRRASWAPHTVHDDVLLDLVPHLVDWLRWLTGSEVVEVGAPHASHDRAVLTLTHQRGMARIEAAADRLHRESIQVRDGTGRTLARHHAGGLVGAVTGRLRTGPHPLVASLTAQLEAFATVVAGGTDEDLGTAADGLAAMAVVDAARASAGRGGRPARLPRPLEPLPC